MEVRLMPKDFIRILQISDIHLFASKDGELLRLNTFQSFLAVLELVKMTIQEHNPDLIVLTGDLSQDASPESYRHLVDQMQFFPGEIAWIAGNHDVTATMQFVLNQSRFNSSKHLLRKNWQIILLDSHQDGVVAGHLSPEELNFLHDQLHSNNHFALVMLHHPVLNTGTAWLDKIGLRNHDDFLQVIDQFSQVKGVICGHAHQEWMNTRNNVLYTITPSTSIQFKTNSPQFALDTLMPGFRILDLFDDGHLATSVRRIAYDARFIPDLSSTGY